MSRLQFCQFSNYRFLRSFENTKIFRQQFNDFIYVCTTQCYSEYTTYCAIIVICLILVLIKHYPVTSRTQRGTDFRFKGDAIRGGRVLVQIRLILQSLYRWETLTSCTNRDLCAYIGLSVPTPRAGL